MKKLYLFFLVFVMPIALCNGQSGSGSELTKGLGIVVESRGSIQCEPYSGLTLIESAQKLISIGIVVKQSYCATYNLIDTVSVCGGGTNELIVHDIPVEQIPDAQRIGFINAADFNYEFTRYDCSK